MKSIIPYIFSFAVGVAALGVWQQFHPEHNDIPAKTEPAHPIEPAEKKPYRSSSLKETNSFHVNEISLQAIRAIVRAELERHQQNDAGHRNDAAFESTDTTEQTAVTEASSDSVSTEQAEAFDNTMTIIEESRSMGVWDNGTRDRFRALLQQVHPSEQRELRLSVIQAMNNGEIVSQIEEPIF